MKSELPKRKPGSAPIVSRPYDEDDRFADAILNGIANRAEAGVHPDPQPEPKTNGVEFTLKLFVTIVNDHLIEITSRMESTDGAIGEGRHTLRPGQTACGSTFEQMLKHDSGVIEGPPAGVKMAA